MRKLFALLAVATVLLGAPACAHAQLGQIDGRIASTFGGQIDTSARATGYVLTFNGTKWVASAASAPTVALDDLTDVAITTPATGNLLRYSGSGWVNVTTTVALDTIGSTQGQVLYRNGTVWTALAVGTNGQVLTSGGAGANVSWTTPAGGGGFTPSAATAITFTNGVSTSITGSSDDGLVLDGGNYTPDDDGNAITFRGGSSTVGTSTGGRVVAQGGGSSGLAGGINIYTGTSDDGNVAGVSIQVNDASGTNRSAGNITLTLGNKTGSGTASVLDVVGTGAATVFKVAYDGTLTFASNSTGAGTALLGATNCPAVTLSAPYTWQKVICADASVGYIPIWK